MSKGNVGFFPIFIDLLGWGRMHFAVWSWLAWAKDPRVYWVHHECSICQCVLERFKSFKRNFFSDFSLRKGKKHWIIIYCINDHLYYDQRHVCLKEEKKKVKQILFGKELEGKVIQASSPMVLTIVIKIGPERTRTNSLV